MSDIQGLYIKKPISIWNKPIEANFKDLFKALTKMTISGMTLNWKEAISGATDAATAIGFQNDVGQVAWLLIYRSIIQAMYKIVEDHFDLIRSSPTAYWHMYDQPSLLSDAVEEITKNLDLSLEQSEVAIDESFFTNPEETSVLQEVKKPLKQWLSSIGLTDIQAATVSNKLPRYFVEALNSEWYTHHESYHCLRDAFDTPFTRATEREKSWLRYTSWLQKQIEEPMFYEAFSLRQIYIPLRAYYMQKKDVRHWSREGSTSELERVVVDLESELELWLTKSDSKDSIRLISGGPGAGKSSFAKIFASKQAMKGERRVLFVPLHRFEPSDDLIDAIGNFVRYDRFLSHNPIDPKEGDSRLLIVFDGLDELSMQGRASREAAQHFIDEIQRKVDRINYQEFRLNILISGRELVIQSHSDVFRQSRQILYLLPFYVPSKFPRTSDLVSSYYKEDFYDPSRLLEVDQRQLWWTAYGTASGQGYEQLPKDLDKHSFVEITSQPLLNYLVALSFIRGKVDFKNENNINLIYADLLDEVYQRVWSDKPHPAVSGISEDQFLLILEEIAISTWHGESRTTTIKEIENRCVSSGMNSLLEKFKEGAKDSLTRLLVAFYFRKFGNRSSTNEESFEFTHKSFGEYLTAKGIVRSVKRMHEELERRKINYGGGWGEGEALLHWIKLCGPVSIDQYIFTFLINEIALLADELGVSEIAKWQHSLSNLLEFVLRQGMPVEGLSPRPTFKEEVRQARHAVASLLISLNACARMTRTVSIINWPSTTTFGNLLSEIQGQRSSGEVELAFKCISFLSLTGQILTGKDLRGANLKGSNLQGVNLKEANLQEADLEGVDLRESNLEHINLNKAILRRANLHNVKLLGAKLQATNCLETNFMGADIRQVNFKNAYLERANFQEANLHSTNLEDANLQEANLQGAKLPGATLKRTDLQRANLQEADLQKANLQWAKLQRALLQRAKFQKAYLRGAQFQFADCKETNFQQANLQEAKFQKANLQKAKLQGAMLQWANFQDADLQQAELQVAKLQSAKLNGANLQGANFQLANLIGAKFLEADLSLANIRGAVIAKDDVIPLREDESVADQQTSKYVIRNRVKRSFNPPSKQ
jgi:uncharacterized protein YjbI with pentapeptide repeats